MVSQGRKTLADNQVRPIQRDLYVRKQRLQQQRPFIIAGIALLGCLLVFLLIVGFDYGINAGKIHYGVRAGGIKIGGKTVEEAQKYLDEQLAVASKSPVKVTYNKDFWEVSSKDIELKFDSNKMARNGFALGRSGNFFENIATRFKAYGGKHSVALVFNTNEEKSARVQAKIQKKTDSSSKNSYVELEGGTFVVHEGNDGTSLNTTVLMRSLAQAMIQSTKSIEAPVDVEKMGVSKVEAQKAAQAAAKLSQTSVKVTHDKKEWNLSSEDIKKLFAFKSSNDVKKDDAIINETTLKSTDGVFLTPYISPELVGKRVIKKMGQDVGHAAVNAKFSTKGGKVAIIPSKNGVGADPLVLSKDIVSVLESSKTPKVVAVKTTAVEPKITTEKAQTMGIKERIGTYSTTFSPGNKARVTNIQLLASSLDNILVAPGATFSFNGAVGERTAEKGYQEAGAIVDGELVEQLGGGICQVNTTLFNAVLLSGLPISQRINHSNYISHYPTGRDATVSWGGPDFKFVNNQKTWVLISSSYSNSSVTISLYGTDPGYDVSLSTSDWSNIKKYPTKEIKDPKLKAGTKVVESSGVDGGVISVTRTVKKDGKQVSQSKFTSHYQPKAQVVRVGTKEEATPEKEEAATNKSKRD